MLRYSRVLTVLTRHEGNQPSGAISQSAAAPAPVRMHGPLRCCSTLPPTTHCPPPPQRSSTGLTKRSPRRIRRRSRAPPAGARRRAACAANIRVSCVLASTSRPARAGLRGAPWPRGGRLRRRVMGSARRVRTASCAASRRRARPGVSEKTRTAPPAHPLRCSHAARQSRQGAPKGRAVACLRMRSVRASAAPMAEAAWCSTCAD